MERRQCLLAIAGLAGVSGCIGDGGSGTEAPPTETFTATDAPTETATASPTATPEPESPALGSLDPEPGRVVEGMVLQSTDIGIAAAADLWAHDGETQGTLTAELQSLDGDVLEQETQELTVEGDGIVAVGDHIDIAIPTNRLTGGEYQIVATLTDTVLDETTPAQTVSVELTDFTQRQYDEAMDALDTAYGHLEEALNVYRSESSDGTIAHVEVTDHDWSRSSVLQPLSNATQAAEEVWGYDVSVLQDDLDVLYSRRDVLDTGTYLQYDQVQANSSLNVGLKPLEEEDTYAYLEHLNEAEELIGNLDGHLETAREALEGARLDETDVPYTAFVDRYAARGEAFSQYLDIADVAFRGLEDLETAREHDSYGAADDAIDKFGRVQTELRDWETEFLSDIRDGLDERASDLEETARRVRREIGS